MASEFIRFVYRGLLRRVAGRERAVAGCGFLSRSRAASSAIPCWSWVAGTGRITMALAEAGKRNHRA